VEGLLFLNSDDKKYTIAPSIPYY